MALVVFLINRDTEPEKVVVDITAEVEAEIKAAAGRAKAVPMPSANHGEAGVYAQ